MSADLSIIVVNWNAGELLRRCFDSLVAFSPSIEYEIVIVDNASSDDSIVSLLRSEHARFLIEEQRLFLILNQDNRGFGAANNQAFAATRTPLLLLLNPDTAITELAIDRMVATLRSSTAFGAIGPKLLNADGSLQISAWRNPPAAWEILLSQLKLYLLIPRKFRGELLLGGHWDHNRERLVPMLSGAAMLVRREVIDDVGGFDERFHMYGEDNEWCARMVRAGWQLVFQPEAVVIHHGAQSSLKRWNNLEKLRVQLESDYLLQQCSLPRRRMIANYVASYFTATMQYLWRWIRGINAPDLRLAKELHLRHLKESLSSTRSQ
ncbi:MAG: glycosyltransferase family 2 protein [Pyrinomonadaceae bacterium]